MKLSKIRLKKMLWNLLGEIKVFLVIFMVSFLGMVVFTNADMFREVLFEKESKVDSVTENTTAKVKNLALSTSKTSHYNSEEPENDQDDQILVEAVQQSIKKYQNNNIIVEMKDFEGTEDYLKDHRKDQLFDFNILPPTDRIVIPSLGVDVPVIDSKLNNVLDFTSSDFDDDLMSGVVKYPTTPEPGVNGNTFLFGHTSQEWRKNNNYSTVFNKLPKLKEGEIINIVWEGKLHNYKMVAKEIVYPKGVEEVYQRYQKVDKDYLTLMGCYPLGSSRKRILVMAERVDI